MKKYNLLLLLALSIVLSACGVTTTLNGNENVLGAERENENLFPSLNTKTSEFRFSNDDFFEDNYNQSYILTDKETNCKYLIVSQYQAGYGTSVTPLLKADGTPDCTK